MIFKKLTSLISAAAIAVSVFASMSVVVSADDTLEPIMCSQSASYFHNNGSPVFVLNTVGTAQPENIVWNKKSSSDVWRGAGVLEFELPAKDAGLIKSAELTCTVNNPPGNSNPRTYSVYQCSFDITADTKDTDVDKLVFGDWMYDGAAINKGASRTDTIPVKDYVKSKIKADETSNIQFAFSNSAQALNIDP